MHILLIHPYFPGQFKHLLPRLLSEGNIVHVICLNSPTLGSFKSSNLHVRPYQPSSSNGADTFPLSLETESKCIRGDSASNIAYKLKIEGYLPDLILGHPGWGDMLFLRDVWPDTPQLHYLEFFYGVPGTDHDFDDIYASDKSLYEKKRTRMKNANLLLNLNEMDWGIAPTRFQHSLLPTWAQQKSSVIHDGINVDLLAPNPSAEILYSDNRVFRCGDPIVTFINRTFEPYRGVHVFLKALSLLQKRNNKVQAILVGSDIPNVSYGTCRTDDVGWLTALRQDLGSELDWSRIHCFGTVSHSILRKIYQVSSVHVYLTYPFVLSWSLLEALSSGCLVIGSSTAPVQEVIKHQFNGLLVPFQDPYILSQQLSNVLSSPEKYLSIRKNARESVQSFDINQSLNKQISLINYVKNIRST